MPRVAPAAKDGASGMIQKWLRAKYRKNGKDLSSVPVRHRTAFAVGNTPKPDQLKAFRLWMWDAGMMASRKAVYRQQMADACRAFDAYLAENSSRAKHRQSGRGGGRNLVVGRPSTRRPRR